MNRKTWIEQVKGHVMAGSKLTDDFWANDILWQLSVYACNIWVMMRQKKNKFKKQKHRSFINWFIPALKFQFGYLGYPKIMRSIIMNLLVVMLTSIGTKAQTFTVDTILYNGNTDKLINIVFMGDGYQTSEFSSFTENSQSASDYLFSISPFMEYKNYFNVFAVKTASAESGANHPRTAPDCPSASVHPLLSVDTYYNSTFDYFNIHRLLVAENNSAINNVLINNFPLYDLVIILVNTPYYGGSGGWVATASTHTSSNELVVHEIGHSYADLADEYWAGDRYARERANMTQESDPLLVKWKNWIGYEGVGVYQHGTSGMAANWYRPHNNCKMRALFNPFCPVCKETITLKTIHKFATPIASYLPNQLNAQICDSLDFSITLYKPSPNTLRVKWKLNDTEISLNKETVRVYSGQLNSGNNTLTVEVLDTTSLIRADNHADINTFSNTWNIDYTPLPSNAGTITGDETVCQGQSAVTYTVPSIENAASYIWTLPDGATGSSTTNSIDVDFGTNAISGDITVKGINVCGEGDISILAITVNGTPATPTITLSYNVISSDTPSGNQWYNQNGLIEGATDQDYTVISDGDYYVIVTLLGCNSDPSNTITVTVTSIESIDTSKIIKVYPNPVSNELIIEIEGNNEKVNFEIYNAAGQVVSKGEFIEKTIVQTSIFAPGLYVVKLSNGEFFEFKKIIKE